MAEEPEKEALIFQVPVWCSVCLIPFLSMVVVDFPPPTPACLLISESNSSSTNSMSASPPACAKNQQPRCSRTSMKSTSWRTVSKHWYLSATSASSPSSS